MLSAQHMVEHVVLSVVVAPAIVLAWRALGLRRPRVGNPWVAWSAFVLVQWTFHLTPLLADSRGEPLLHAVEHLVYLGAGVWFWYPVLGAGLGDPGRSLYLFLAAPAIDVVGALLMARGEEGAGVAMLAGSLPIVAAAIAITWRWLAREQREATILERTHGAAG
jgi:cytochrome c oxidase assembly factor CtaG